MALDADKFILPDGVPVDGKQKTKSSTLGIANILDKLSALTQVLAGSVNFAAGKRVEYEGVPIEAPENGVTQVTAVPSTSGTITLSSDDMSYRENNGDVNVNGVLVVSATSSPAGSIVTISPMPFSAGAGTEDRSTGLVAIRNATTTLFTNYPAVISNSSNALTIRMDASLIESGDQIYPSLNFGKA